MHRNVPSVKCSVYVPERKTRKHLSDGWSFGCSPFWMRQKVSQCGLQITLKAAPENLWWAGKLSGCTVFPLLVRTYRIHNLKSSQNHTSEAHSFTVSIFVACHTAQRTFSKGLSEILRSKQRPEDNLGLRNLALADMTNSSDNASRMTDPAYTQTCNLFADYVALQTHQYFTDTRLQGKTAHLLF